MGRIVGLGSSGLAESPGFPGGPPGFPGGPSGLPEASPGLPEVSPGFPGVAPALFAPSPGFSELAVGCSPDLSASGCALDSDSEVVVEDEI
ncbi:MAG: hypothetical protein ABSA77_06115 [Thermoguttaceae bacterium]